MGGLGSCRRISLVGLMEGSGVRMGKSAVELSSSVSSSGSQSSSSSIASSSKPR